MTNRTVGVDFIARVQGYVGGVSTMIASSKEFEGELTKLATTHKEKFNQITNVVAGAGVALAGYAALAVKTSMTFDKTISGVAAVSNANVAQLAQLRSAAIETGKVTAFTATSAAEAEADLEKAGVSTADVLGGALTGSVNLAAAAQIDLGDAATDTATDLNIFGLSGSQASHVADVLTASANKSATDVGQMSQAIAQAGLVSHQTGLSFEQTAGTLALFAQNGLVGSDAGTSFKTMLQQLQAPSEKSAALMKSLGINAYNASGAFIGITQFAQQLKDKLGPLTQAQRDNALAQIFGSDATRSATILYKAGATGLQQWIDGVNDSGIAAKTAKTQMDNLSGDVEQLKGSFETLAIQSSGGVTKGLRDITQGATGLLNKIIDLPTPLTETGTVLSGVAGTALLGAAGFVKAKGAVSDFLETLSNMGPTGEKASSAIGKIGSAAGKLGVAGVAIGLLYAGIEAISEWAAKKSAPAARNIDGLTSSLKDLAGGLGVAGELAKTFGDNLDKLPADISQVTDANIKLAALDAKIAAVRNSKVVGAGAGLRYDTYQRDLTAESAAQQTSDLKALDTALAQMVNNGGAAQATISLDDLASRQNLSNQQWAELLKLLPQYEAASHGVAQANAGLAKGFGDAAANTRTLADGLDDAIAKGQTFDTVWTQLNGALLNSDQADLAANQAIENVTKTLKDNKDAWKGNSDAALADKISIGQAAKSAADAAQAKFEETGSVSAANDVYQTYIASLRKALLAAGLSKTAVDELLKSYAQMPPAVTTPITQPGMDKALAQTQSLHDLIYDIPKTPTITFKITAQGTKVLNELDRYGTANRWGGIYQHAADGYLNDASIYSAVSSGARYAFAEPSTGGEAFIPRYGDYARSIGILGHAAAWYGQMLVPAMRSGLTRGGDGASMYSHTTNVYPKTAVLDGPQLEQYDRVREIRQRVGR